MTETTVELADGCALVVARYYDNSVGAAVRYIERSAPNSVDGETAARIELDTARAMIALLVEAFGPAVLPGAGGAE